MKCPLMYVCGVTKRCMSVYSQPLTILMAVMAHSSPLLPSMPPHRSCACSRVLHVSTPFPVQVGQALRGTLADVVEVGGIAANDASDGDNGIHQTGVDEPRGTIDEFEAARNELHLDVFFAHSMLDKCLAGTFQQGSGYLVVPFADYDAYTHAGSIGHGIDVVVGEIMQG